MSEEFKIEIVNPEKSFLSKEDVTEVIVPAFEGEMGILKDHISIISFLKPGIITIHSNSGEEKFYVEDGIIEFKNNNLSVLTSLILNLKDMKKNVVANTLLLSFTYLILWFTDLLSLPYQIVALYFFVLYILKSAFSFPFVLSPQRDQKMYHPQF